MYDSFSFTDPIFLIGLLIGVAILLIPFILFLLTLQRTMQIISPENRKMPPGQVWLMMIPLFNIVWQFIMIGHISDSIKAECVRLNVSATESRPAYNAGLIYCVCNIASGFIPFIGFLALLISWIVYWIKVYQYKKLLIENKDNYMLDAEKQIFNTSSL